MIAGIGVLIFALFGPPFSHPPTPTDSARVSTGRVVGKVILSSAVTARKMRFRLYADLGSGATPKQAPEVDEMANVVVYLDSLAAGPGRRPERKRMSQRDEIFSPHVVAVQKGDVVEFVNDDPFFHNVFSLSSPKAFDLGRFPRGHTKSVQFDHPGIVKVFCHIHADMSAAIVVLDHPFFTTPGESGAFELSEIPPGEYRVVAWHERAKAVVGRVRVVAGETARVDFNIPVSHDVAAK